MAVCQARSHYAARGTCRHFYDAEKSIKYLNSAILKRLQEKLQDACDHPEMVMEMKKHAADFICKKYNWDDVVEETMKLYRRK